MNYDPEKHQRRSIRMRGYDYSGPGQYFVTICVQGWRPLYGAVRNDEMILNDAGRMVERWWAELANKFLLVDLGLHITMPNHFHCIIEIVDPRQRVYEGKVPPERSAPLSEIIQWFKTMTTNDYIAGVKKLGWPRFEGKLWQRNYYEHTINSLRALRNIREYIRGNPRMWKYDRVNPDGTAPDRDEIGNMMSGEFDITEDDLNFILSFE
jgi:REP element-mobilizing transposase RayT